MTIDNPITRRALGAGALGVGTAAIVAGALPLAAGAAEAALTRQSISLEEAKVLLQAAEKKASEIGVPMYVLVVDESGRERASWRMDGNGLASLTLVPLKAHTAVAFRTPTHVLAERVAADPVRLASFVATGEFTLIGGGLPVVRDGQVIGAIGVGGGSPEQDVVVGQAALDALST